MRRTGILMLLMALALGALTPQADAQVFKPLKCIFCTYQQATLLAFVDACGEVSPPHLWSVAGGVKPGGICHIWLQNPVENPKGYHAFYWINGVENTQENCDLLVDNYPECQPDGVVCVAPDVVERGPNRACGGGGGCGDPGSQHDGDDLPIDLAPIVARELVVLPLLDLPGFGLMLYDGGSSGGPASWGVVVLPGDERPAVPPSEELPAMLGDAWGLEASGSALLGPDGSKVAELITWRWWEAPWYASEEFYRSRYDHPETVPLRLSPQYGNVSLRIPELIATGNVYSDVLAFEERGWIALVPDLVVRMDKALER